MRESVDHTVTHCTLFHVFLPQLDCLLHPLLQHTRMDLGQLLERERETFQTLLLNMYVKSSKFKMFRPALSNCEPPHRGEGSAA